MREPGKCREHSPESVDGDCFGLVHKEWCADAYAIGCVYESMGDGREPGIYGYRCFPVSAQEGARIVEMDPGQAEKMHDPSKCR